MGIITRETSYVKSSDEISSCRCLRGARNNQRESPKVEISPWNIISYWLPILCIRPCNSSPFVPRFQTLLFTIFGRKGEPRLSRLYASFSHYPELVTLSLRRKLHRFNISEPKTSGRNSSNAETRYSDTSQSSSIARLRKKRAERRNC